jgi:hypothetical protein
MERTTEGFSAAFYAVITPVHEAAKQCREGVFLLHAQFALLYCGEVRPARTTISDKQMLDLLELVRRFEPMNWEIRYRGTDFEKMPDGFCVAYSTREPRYTVPEMQEWMKKHVA